MFSWRNPQHTPFVVAHRGSSAIAPENTLAAFQQAIDDGADAIELDVRLSKDGEVVVIHDEKLSRTTDGRGRVSDYTLKELKQFSAGKWFHRRFSRETIPTLAEVFALLQGKVGVNIEMKEGHFSSRRHNIVDRCIDTIRGAGASVAVLISSFHYPYVKRSRNIEPSIATGVLYHPVHQLARSPLRIIRSSDADFFIVNKSFFRKYIVQFAHHHHILAGVYTVNTLKETARALLFGADVIFTDDPAKIFQFFTLLK